MNNIKFLGLIPALALFGCPDDNEDSATEPPAPICFQQDAVDAGQVNFVEEAVTIDGTTLAIGTTQAAPATALPAGFDAADYYGAVDPTAAEGWWSGWTVINSAIDGNLPGADFHPLQDDIEGDAIDAAAESACQQLDANYGDGGTVTIFGEAFPVCVVSMPITADVSWPNNHVFYLTETVTVGEGDVELNGAAPASTPTLTIAEGTQVFGAPGATSLVISRGAQIDVNGTAERPVIFGAVAGDANGITGDPTDLTGRGEWGGIILSGFGMTNSGDGEGELLTEAAPTDAVRWFGGMDNADSSGSIRYAVIAESGFEFREDEEVQGLTIEAAGSGTEIDYLQVIGSEDDAIEWFGGAAGASHVLIQGFDDDGFDQDLGWQGNLQFAIAIMGNQNGDRAIESDNNGDNFEAEPQTAPNIANMTLIGDAGKDATTVGALHREGWRGKVFRSVYTDGDATIGGAWEGGCLDIDDVAPSALEYNDVIFNCTPGPLLECGDDE